MPMPREGEFGPDENHIAELSPFEQHQVRLRTERAQIEDSRLADEEQDDTNE